jgi:diguanylate cyclase (GGDEF)-like protein
MLLVFKDEPGFVSKSVPATATAGQAFDAGGECQSVTDAAPAPARPRPTAGEAIYGGLLFTGALLAIAFVLPGSTATAQDWPVLFFFLLFGLFTIAIGYAHPVFGHVSFDRVAQVSSILVLGPIDAAWINGLASLLYPWHRLRNGVPLPNVALAALTNAGLMTLMVLGSGLLYVAIGGAVPLMQLGLETLTAVVLLLLAMQVVNEGGMMILVRMRTPRTPYALSWFDIATELMAGLAAVLVAIVWNRMEVEVFLLLLTVFIAGMLALKSFAEMRLRLERLVEKRTGALHEKTQQLERLLARDPLTGLYSRRHADEFLLREIARARTERRAIAVALADIDHFKNINDEHSHGIGDRVLEQVGRIFAGQARDCDLVARYGGEEFVFCFIGVGETDAARMCEELRLVVEREDWDAVSPGLRVTISIGLAFCDTEPAASTLLDHADACLYRAKRSGRNRVEAGTVRSALPA